MSNYATDTDLLHFEPGLFKDAAIPSQTLLAGTGNLAGSTFTIAVGSFLTAGVEAGHVIWLGGSINGCFPVVAINSATSIEITVLYDQLTPESAETSPLPVGTGSALPFKIQTARPQIALVSEMIRRVLGVTDPAEILNPAVLRRTTALGALQMLYSATAAIAINENQLSTKAGAYERLYQRSLRAVQVEIDRNGDGVVDLICCPGVPRLARVS